MTILINLNDARKKLNELEGSAEYNKGVTDAFNALFDLPTIEAEPIKHGRWELKYHKLWGREFPTCTVCGNPFYATRYCPNCGAKMGGPAIEKQQGASNEEKNEKSLKGLADKICDLINQPYFSKLAKACNIVVCDLCENADQCKHKPLSPGVQCIGWEPIGGRKK